MPQHCKGRIAIYSACTNVRSTLRRAHPRGGSPAPCPTPHPERIAGPTITFSPRGQYYGEGETLSPGPFPAARRSLSFSLLPFGDLDHRTPDTQVLLRRMSPVSRSTSPDLKPPPFPERPTLTPLVLAGACGQATASSPQLRLRDFEPIAQGERPALLRPRSASAGDVVWRESVARGGGKGGGSEGGGNGWGGGSIFAVVSGMAEVSGKAEAKA